MDKEALRDINRELIGNGTFQNFIPTILSESTEDDLDYSCGRSYRTPVDSVLLRGAVDIFEGDSEGNPGRGPCFATLILGK